MSRKSDMLSEIARKLFDLPMHVLVVVCQLIKRLSREDWQEWFIELKKFMRKEKCWAGAIVNPFLKLISGDELLILDAVDGSENIADAEDIFDYIDPNFRICFADEKGERTEETVVRVYEVTKRSKFPQIFGKLNSNLEKFCFTQHQIKNFVKKYRKWFQKDGYAMFFLFKSHGYFFVASVRSHSDDELNVVFRRFEYDFVWGADGRRRVVIPQLA
jgi:hypothetical protein